MQKNTASPKKEYRVMSRRGVIACAVLTLLTPLGLLLIRLAKGQNAWIEQNYSLGWYRGAARVLTSITGGVPFSVMEVLLLLAAAGALLYLVCWVIEVIRHRSKWWAICLKRLWILVCIASGIFFWFLLTGDLNYYRQPVGTSLGLSAKATDEETLQNLCTLLAQQGNTYRAGTEEDERGVFRLSADYDVLAQGASQAVEKLDEQYEVQLFSLASCTRPKAMMFSETMSYLRLTGVIFPYVMEANINVHQPDYGIPSTMCHELSHICGFMREDEANFISYLACIGSGKQDFVYSGTVLALIHATNQLYAINRDAWEEVRALLSQEVRRDLTANSLYWAQYDTPVGDAANKVNDSYLKANDQAEGVRSYGRMVDLLTAYYQDAGVI